MFILLLFIIIIIIIIIITKLQISNFIYYKFTLSREQKRINSSL